MTTLLRLDSSPRSSSSHSRGLADLVEQQILALDNTAKVVTRDLATEAIPHISNDTITGFYTPAEEFNTELKAATALSDELILELNSADCLLISAPIYNFGVPSSLKSWVDQIVRINKTFAFSGDGFTGLVPVKRAVLALAYGAQGYSAGSEMAAMNFLEPYLVSLLTFLGIKHIDVFSLEGTSVLSPTEITEQKTQQASAIAQALGAV